MPKTRRRRVNSPADDEILRLNKVGLSLTTMANILDMHPTSVTLRLKSLGATPTDTRRAFMEDVLADMDETTQNALVEHMIQNDPMTIKDFVRSLIIKEFNP